AFLIDGDTDIATKECVIVYGCSLRRGRPVNILIGHIEVEHAHAQGIYAASKKSFAALGDQCSNWLENIIALGADGAAVNLGTKGGVIALLQPEAGSSGLEPSVPRDSADPKSGSSGHLENPADPQTSGSSGLEPSVPRDSADPKSGSSGHLENPADPQTSGSFSSLFEVVEELVKGTHSTVQRGIQRSDNQQVLY
ncbi:putative tripartite motif-containing protein 16-like, partial [Triplophysa rosa]